MFERFLGPYPVVTTPAANRLKELAEGALNRKVSHHYGGFLRAMIPGIPARVGEGDPQGQVPALRLSHRPHRRSPPTGKLVTDVTELYEPHEFPQASELVKLKRERESALLLAEDEPRFLEDLSRLERKLADAESRSMLPEEAPNREVERFVVEERLRP